MKGNKKHISKDDFQRYLENQMTNAERNAFERELQKNPFEAEALQGFQRISPHDLEKDLKDISGRIKSGKKKNNTRYWAAAASLLLLISSGVIWFQMKDKLSLPEVSQIKSIQKEEIKTQLPETENPELSVLSEVKDSGTTFSVTGKPIPKKVEKKKAALPSVTIGEKREEAELEKPVQIALVSEPIQEEKALTESIVTAAPKPEIRIRGVSTLNAKRKTEAGNGLPASLRVVGDSKIVWGKVISLGDSQPLPGVTIVEKGTSNGTVSDLDGNFALKLAKNSDSVLVASFVGMEKKEFYPVRDSSLIVGLEPSSLAMDEVVTIAYGVSSKSDTPESIENARPQSGMNAFRKYLAEKAILPNDYPKKKVVVKVSLQIDRHGEINSVENAGHSESSVFELAKQILLNGPAWNPEMINVTPVESSVTLRIVFRKEK